mmetsp:Transcript_95991/g.250235  ORF Transcript_95991/g.250235 Transcript_95991/m.250235 type:complete len:313 (-) Transcript_95991:253-1191(-)
MVRLLALGVPELVPAPLQDREALRMARTTSGRGEGGSRRCSPVLGHRRFLQMPRRWRGRDSMCGSQSGPCIARQHRAERRGRPFRGLAAEYCDKRRARQPHESEPRVGGSSRQHLGALAVPRGLPSVAARARGASCGARGGAGCHRRRTTRLCAQGGALPAREPRAAEMGRREPAGGDTVRRRRAPEAALLLGADGSPSVRLPYRPAAAQALPLLADDAARRGIDPGCRQLVVPPLRSLRDPVLAGVRGGGPAPSCHPGHAAGDRHSRPKHHGVRSHFGRLGELHTGRRSPTRTHNRQRTRSAPCVGGQALG